MADVDDDSEMNLEKSIVSSVYNDEIVSDNHVSSKLSTEGEERDKDEDAKKRKLNDLEEDKDKDAELKDEDRDEKHRKKKKKVIL